MSRFFAYDPEQAYLLPPNAKDVLGSEHLCFRVHAMVEQLDVSWFEQAYGAEGRLAYPPRMMLKVWLYAFCIGVSSTRRLERRMREDLAFRYLAGGLEPDHKTLSEFLRRHRRAINDVFTQVVQMARRAGLGKLGHVAIDSTRVRANASRHRVVSWEQLRRQQWARDRRLVRAFQQKASAQDPEEDGGVRLSPEQTAGAGRASGTGVAEKGTATSFADRSGEPVSAHGARLGTGLHGGSGGERRSCDCGDASDAKRDRQRFAGGDGGGSGTALPGAAGKGDGRFWFFQRASFARDEAARD
jgi:transposase